MISDLNVYANDIKKLIKDNFYQDQIDERNNQQKKNVVKVYVFTKIQL